MTERVIRLLGLFSLERPVWTAEQIAAELGVVVSSAYRLISALAGAGYIEAMSPGRYVLGPAIIQLDRQIQLTDPLLQAATPVMTDLVGFAPEGSVVLLCRAFRDSVLCVHQIVRGPQPKVSYERGKPRPLFRGATSKSILVFTPTRQLQRLYKLHAEEIARSGLGESWEEFHAILKRMRKTPFVIGRGEVDAGRFGISAPILGRDRGAIGSLSYVLDATRADERTVNRLSSMIVAAAREIERHMETLASPAMPMARATPRRPSAKSAAGAGLTS
jgi:DNA-binding IclR family transcriptional regulator